MKKIDQIYIWIANKINETEDENEKEYLFSISEYLSQTEDGKKLAAEQIGNPLCKHCNGTGYVQIAPNIKGIKSVLIVMEKVDELS